MTKIKVIVGKVINKYHNQPDEHITRTLLIDPETGSRIAWFEFVSVWLSYKKDQRLPETKRKLKTRNKLRMTGGKKGFVSVTFKRKNGKEIENGEMVLRRLLAKDGRYIIQ